MREIKTSSVTETEQFAEEFAKELKPGTVLAFFGGMGVGKTAFTRGLARGLGITAAVASPTFAIVNDYGGNPPLAHFDMYRIESWEDLYSTGFFDYIDAGYILAVEWSENIENALPEDSIRVTISRGENENDRLITIEEGI
ncbi:MAG: tRNA (adenosine(37)-N6)-threonylcarbamoyltransferase complex ATPase subunit type 1 TsaE [Clostridiales bacterium]|nr:tRNA (adenosine(37)-N6)-threonylcarbamoyltransferase complex ATPase subunit type 1 TsaE [Clostridiales bacterium]